MQAATLPSLACLRDRALGESGRADAEGLEAFLQAPAPEALRLWFGEAGAGASGADLRLQIDRDLCALDTAITRLCNAIIHHPRFQELEAAWRGLYWLSGALTPDGLTIIRILDCRWSELARDLERAAEFDQSALFDKIYNQEFGMPGGVPFSLLIGLYEVQHRPTRDHPTDDVSVLRRLSGVAAAAFAPIMLGVRPQMLGVEAFGELERRASIASVFRSAEYTRFNAFRATPDARFVGLAAPRILLRAPYRGREVGDCGFQFQEDCGEEGQDRLWGVGALVIGQICLRAFEDYRWLAAIRGTVPDTLAAGVVVDLPWEDFETDARGVILRFPVEINLTEQLERDLTDAGLVPIRRCRDTPYLVVNNLASAGRSDVSYTKDIATTNAQLSTMLNYVLCVSRFAHYVKVIARDWIGSFISPQECQTRLMTWLNGYCSIGDDLSFELRARYPLERASVQVSEIVGRPGSYECALLLKPHLQLDQAISEFQLVTVIQGVQRQL